MNTMAINTEAMRQAFEGSLAGKLTFPEVIGLLAPAGVESYNADLVRGENTFYTLDGETHVERAAGHSHAVADDFSQPALAAAIRAAQADEIRYPEFVKRATAAGVVSYRVFITGRRAIYFGRKGEFHVEEFPGKKS